MKPTYGLLPTAGVKQAAPSLDTVGLFARDLDVLDDALDALIGSPSRADADTPTFILVRTDLWDGADEDCQRVVVEAASMLNARPRELPDQFVGLAADLSLIQAFEGARSLAWERTVHPELLSPELSDLLDSGEQVAVESYASAMQRAARARGADALGTLFGDADVIVTPASVGEAPLGLSSTGDPRFNRLWTLLGCPALSVPGFVGASGLPIGVQLVARPYRESLLVRAGRELEAMFR